MHSFLFVHIMKQRLRWENIVAGYVEVLTFKSALYENFGSLSSQVSLLCLFQAFLYELPILKLINQRSFFIGICTSNFISRLFSAPITKQPNSSMSTEYRFYIHILCAGHLSLLKSGTCSVEVLTLLQSSHILCYHIATISVRKEGFSL